MKKVLKAITFLVSLFFIWIGINSCGNKQYTEEGIMEIVHETDAVLDNFTGQKYEWASPKAYSTIMAYYPKTDIIFLNEDLKFREPAEAVNFYYYKDGYLIHFVSKKLTYTRNKKNTVKKGLSKLTLNLDPDGDVISYESIINGRKVNLDSDELEEVLKHSKELYRLVGDQSD